MKVRKGEVAVYVDGGNVQAVLTIDPKKVSSAWKSAPYTLIDFDIDGTPPDEVCYGCVFSPNPHFNMCGYRNKKKA